MVVIFFDPHKEKLGVGPIWVCLLRLSQHLWSSDVLRCIRDNLGIYLDHDRSYIESGSIAIARIYLNHDRSYIESMSTAIAIILVHLDTREGLVESLHLQSRELITWQILN